MIKNHEIFKHLSNYQDEVYKSVDYWGDKWNSECQEDQDEFFTDYIQDIQSDMDSLHHDLVMMLPEKKLENWDIIEPIIKTWCDPDADNDITSYTPMDHCLQTFDYNFDNVIERLENDKKTYENYI